MKSPVASGRRVQARLVSFMRFDRPDAELNREIDAYLRLLGNGLLADGIGRIGMAVAIAVSTAR